MAKQEAFLSREMGRHNGGRGGGGRGEDQWGETHERGERRIQGRHTLPSLIVFSCVSVCVCVSSLTAPGAPSA